MRTMYALVLVSLAIPACDSPPPPPPLRTAAVAHIKEVHAQLRSFQVPMASFEPTRLEADARVTRGAYRIALPNGEAHDMRVELRQAITKGDGDTSIAIDDMTAAASATFTLSEEDASAQIVFNGNTVPLAFNPDKTITVDGQTFPDAQSAGTALSQHPALASMPGEIVAALQQTMIESLGISEPTAKWEIVVSIVISFVVDTACDWGCNTFGGGPNCQNDCSTIGELVLEAAVDAII